MIQRPFWTNRLHEAWKAAPVAWLAGVRRFGKTTLAIRRNRDEVDAIECKWDPRQFETAALRAFRARYPGGSNYLVCPNAGPGYQKSMDGLNIIVVDPSNWRKAFFQKEASREET
jgi:hypothetical protein